MGRGVESARAARARAAAVAVVAVAVVPVAAAFAAVAVAVAAVVMVVGTAKVVAVAKAGMDWAGPADSQLLPSAGVHRPTPPPRSVLPATVRRRHRVRSVTPTCHCTRQPNYRATPPLVKGQTLKLFL